MCGDWTNTTIDHFISIKCSCVGSIYLVKCTAPHYLETHCSYSAKRTALGENAQGKVMLKLQSVPKGPARGPCCLIALVKRNPGQNKALICIITVVLTPSLLISSVGFCLTNSFHLKTVCCSSPLQQDAHCLY